jgi:K+-sensing histidine kinase KdpD
MGIGLSVCSTIIKAHGSRIHARNLPTGGAEFSFTLDLED